MGSSLFTVMAAHALMPAAAGDHRRRRLTESLDEGSFDANGSFTILHTSYKSKVCTCKNARGRDVVVKAYTIAELSDIEVEQARF